MYVTGRFFSRIAFTIWSDSACLMRQSFLPWPTSRGLEMRWA